MNMRKLKDYIVEIADEADGFIIIEAMNEESACRKAEKLGYEVFYAHEYNDKKLLKEEEKC